MANKDKKAVATMYVFELTFGDPAVEGNLFSVMVANYKLGFAVLYLFLRYIRSCIILIFSLFSAFQPFSDACLNKIIVVQMRISLIHTGYFIILAR